MARGAGRGWGWVVAVLVVGVVGAGVVFVSLDRKRGLDPANPSVATQPDPRPDASPKPATPPPPTDVAADKLPTPWAIVSLDRVRAAMPNTVYWRRAAPTEDPQLLQEREEERSRRNIEYGKVLSGTATEAEIHAYYADRRRLSTDYIEFVTYVLNQYGPDLPERDVGLLELARRLHLARLEEIPRKTQEALERKRVQDEARRAWLAGEQK
jgi:hypothetical protein